ncbi:TetR/AcrR family transcriptional regulator [Marinilactibacillus psychrotolerans]|uniref:TetR/AcrR family transcriptional regulator n=1 Tax=Marinilactibacillus psychrotolerans TaxID=191770 RepID=A0A5R9C5U0_9LACT|nr:TetR/AcrR family transcriptional regulator [Marinilactibacillus psychrotolerans]TLQ08404.1 TetR/AcrR family transcriptional regulator [Marinilactibacillus psychrotolerans]
MSRGFNEREKQVITNSLIEQGRILFSKLGFQKTSILEITKNVGIAQGTFYKFFNSKEELYFVILEMEEEKIKEQFANVDIFKENQPNKAIKSILRQMINTIETNPLIRELYFGSSMKDMLKKLSPELLEKHFKNDATSFLPLIEKLKNKGFIIEENPEVIAGVARSLFVLTLHQNEIGVAVYQETIELLIDLIVDGLIKVEGI